MAYSIVWLTPLSHDFGTIKQGQTVSWVFKFKNTSDKAVTIDNVRTDCGCTASQWADTPIPPQGEGTIELTFFAQKRGKFRKKATVWWHHSKTPDKLDLVGEVVR